LRDKISLATRANYTRAGPLRKKSFQDEGNQQKPVMPERCDVISFHRLFNNAHAVVDFVAERPGPNLEQAKSERDQPLRAPAFDLQGFLRGPRREVSSAQR